MAAFLLAVFSFLCGAICVYFGYETRRRRTLELQEALAEKDRTLKVEQQALQEGQDRLKRHIQDHNAELVRYQAARTEFDARVVSYQELVAENKLLKTDCRNMHLAVARSQFEQNEITLKQQVQDGKADELGRAYMQDTVKWIKNSLNTNNYAACKQRLQTAVAKVREIGVAISSREESDLIADLQKEYEMVVRAALEREEQARIRAQMREEALREREAKLKVEQAERERLAIEAALAKAMRETLGQHSAEIERLKAQLDEAVANSQRAKSQAELTKTGNVYVISNIGSFGVDVFKIGMTRRLDPLDRILELGDASVPFPFDVHMMIATDDAPKLENALHKAFHRYRVNKTNPRKEFFRIDLASIIKVVEEHHGQVQYVADAAALEYRNSLLMSDADTDFVEAVFEEAKEDQPEASGADEE